MDYPDYVLQISEGGFSEDMHFDYWYWAERLRRAAPADAEKIVDDFTDPIYQVQEVVDAGGGALQFSTDAYKRGSLEILEYCVDAGYRLE
ncbi:hypothetical protein ASD19_01805 [Microbacterium sp. Root53]|nr:hypothetical protein ASD19_01805 [Microbacterium sp. Root53]